MDKPPHLQWLHRYEVPVFVRTPHNSFVVWVYEHTYEAIRNRIRVYGMHLGIIEIQLIKLKPRFEVPY